MANIAYIENWNDDYEFNVSIHSAFEKCVKENSDKAAIKYYDESISYYELNEYANKIARLELQLSNNTECNTCIMLDKSPDLIASVLATFKAGNVYIPLNPSNPKERTLQVLQVARPSIIITEKKFLYVFEELELFGDPNVNVLCVDSEVDDRHDDSKCVCNYSRNDITTQGSENLDVKISGDKLAYVIFTSGTSGKPKSVPIRHMSVMNMINSVYTLCELKKSDRSIFITNIGFDVSISDMLVPLLKGLGLIIYNDCDVNNPERLRQIIQVEKPTLIQSTSSRFKQLYCMDNYFNCSIEMPPMEKYIFAGEELDVQCSDIIINKFGKELFNLYGPTETTVYSTFKKIERTINIGFPFYNTEIFILDEKQNVLEKNMRGEIAIGGVGLSEGYFMNDDLNKAKFIEHPFDKEKKVYLTGDIGIISDDDELYIFGRCDDQFKLRGFRIEKNDIVSTMYKTNMIQDVYVCMEKDSNNIDILIAYIVKNENMDPELYFKKLKDLLPEYMIPAKNYCVESIPLNINAKVDVQRLKNGEKKLLVSNEFQGSKTKWELLIRDIWKEVLKESDIGVHDNFFEIGGNSLTYYYMLSVLYEEHGIKLGCIDMKNINTISKIGELISNTVDTAI